MKNINTLVDRLRDAIDEMRKGLHFPSHIGLMQEAVDILIEIKETNDEENSHQRKNVHP